MAKARKAKNTPARGTPEEPTEDAFKLHLIAAASGDLLYRLASVVITQFPGVPFQLTQHSLVHDREALKKVLRKVSSKRSIVLHALADPLAKQLVRERCAAKRVPEFDATGPLVDFVSDCVGRPPDNDVQRLLQLDEAYVRRINAMEFSLEHDDGLGLGTIDEAEIVIVGVSRVSKSPTAIYMGSRGFKTANVSISPQTGFPNELSKARRGRVVAFTLQPARLQQIRTQRMQGAGVEGTEYDDLRAVIREVMAAEAEYRKRGYPVIDITDMTIEQTAARILKLLKLPPR